MAEIKLNMSHTRKIAYNTVAQMVGKVAGIGISLVTVAALFRYFGVEGIGKYTTVFAFVAFFSVFADFGLQWTLIRELTVNPDKNKVFKNIFTFRLILAVIVHALAFGLVWFFKYPIDVKIGVGIITLAWFFTTINSTLVGVFLNNYRLDISVTAEFIGRLVILGLVLFLIKLQLSLGIVLMAYLVGNAVNFLIDMIYVQRYVEFGFAYDKKYWRHAISQAIPIGIVLVFGYVYYKIDSLMLSMMKSMTDVGIYGTAYKLLEVLQIVPSMFLGAAFPLITKYASTSDKRIYPAFQKQFDFLMLLAIPLVGGTFVLASPIISLIGGSRGGEFIGSSTVSFLGSPITSVTCLKILIFSVGINFLSNLYNYMVVSLGRQKAMVFPTILFAVFNIGLNLFLIPRYSYLGAAAATLLTEIAVMTTTYFVTRKFISLPLNLLNFAKILFSGIVMVLATSYLYAIGINLFINIFVAIVVYTVLVLAMKVVTKEMILGILRKQE